jgi:ParB/RepB/Spo0J family partition protein
MKKQTLNLNDVRCVRNRELSDDDIRSMAASIGNTMLLAPIILTRADDDKLEVVAGRCRYFALQQLQRFELTPEDYKIISNEDAQLISFIENFERRQLSILEEAEQIGQLLLHHDVMEIATILGRSDKYIRFRANINKLSDCWKKVLRDDKFPALKTGHYEVISRFPESIQKKIIKCEWRFTDPASIPQFTKDLDSEYSRLLLQAPFDTLACGACRRRSLMEPWLFEELKDNDSDRCLDPECWDKNVASFVKAEIKKIEKASTDIVLVHNEYIWDEEKRYKNSPDTRKFEMLEVPVDKDTANAFIISGGKVGSYCRIRKNNSESSAPKKPLTIEDKHRQLQSRRVKKALTDLNDKIRTIESAPRPDDNLLMNLAAELVVKGSALSNIDDYDKQDSAEQRDRVWKAVIDNIAVQLHCHAFSPLDNIDDKYGKVACKVLGLPWDEYIKHATEEIKTPKTLEK